MSEMQEQLMVLTENFEEEHPGVFVGVKGFKLPLLMPFVLVNETTEEELFGTDGFEEIREELEGAVNDFGTVVGITSRVRGYPIQELPNNISIQRIIYYNEQYFRLYHLFVDDNAAGVTCYVPYSESLSNLDLWNKRRKDYPVTTKHPSERNTICTSEGDFTLH